MSALSSISVRVIAIAIAVSTWPALAEGPYFSYAFSKQYEVPIPDDLLERSPSWDEKEPNPPVTAKRAIELAVQMKDSLVKDGKNYKWKLTCASLYRTESGKWFWMVQYDAVYSRSPTSSRDNYLRLAVLMDGTIIRPRVHDYPR